jgi:hypothetical protein
MHAAADAARAVALDPTYARGWVRRAMALEGLGRLADASAAAAQAAALSPASDVCRLAARLASLVPIHDAEDDEVAERTTSTWVTRVCSSAGAGRFVRANSDLQAGRAVMVDQPLAAVLNKAHRKTHCAWCFAPLPRLAAVPCARCPGPLYCSSLCAESDGAVEGSSEAPTHGGNGECRAPWALVLDSEAVLATRLATMSEVVGSELAAVGCSLVTHWADMLPEHRLQNASASTRHRPALLCVCVCEISCGESSFFCAMLLFRRPSK